MESLEKHIEVVLGDLGHQLLLVAKDSSSPRAICVSEKHTSAVLLLLTTV